MKSTVIAIMLVVMFASIGFYFVFKKTPEVVILEGYEHATVICGNSLVINDGHFNDPEVKQLIELAQKECKK